MNTPMEVPDLFKWATPCSPIFFIHVVCMVITAVVSVLFQHRLVFSFSLLHKYSCDPCSLTWPWGHPCKPLKANNLFPAAPQTQLHANFTGVAGPITQSRRGCRSSVPPGPASSKVFPTDIPPHHNSMYTYTPPESSADRAQHSCKCEQHQWPHPGLLSGWSGR